jgi:hypothetical protein
MHFNHFLIKCFFCLFLILPNWRCAYVDVDVQLDEFNKILKDFKTETVGALDYGISSLNKNSADWQQTLRNIQNQLVSDLQSTIRIEITNLLKESEYMIGTIAQCQLDIIGIKVRNQLEQIKARLLDLPAAATRPYVCGASPSEIDMSITANRRTNIKFFGYFENTGYRVFLIKRNGISRNITFAVAKQSPYEINLNLGSNGIELTADDNQIEVRPLNDNTAISTVNVIQPLAPKCFVGEMKIFPRNVGNPYTFTPKAYCTTCGYDFEFGNSPVQVFCDVSLEAVGNSIYANIRMSCNEKGGDKTFVISSERRLIHSIEPDKIITGFVTGTYHVENYVNLKDQVEERGGSGPVQKFKFFIRNDKTQDINVYTRVDIYWNELIIKVKQVGNCKP